MDNKVVKETGVTTTDPFGEDIKMVTVRSSLQDLEITDITVTDGIHPTGDHFFKERSVSFYVAEGSGIVRIFHANEDGSIDGNPEWYFVGKGDLIEIPPQCRYRLDLDGGSRLIRFMKKRAEKSDEQRFGYMRAQ
jgi:hypothetical protein